MTTDPKSEWLNAVAHDLKTPINSIRGCLELVQQLGPLNERQQHFTNRALAGLQRMEHLVARLLDISWIDAGMQLQLADCDLGVMIHEAVDLLKEMADQRQVTLYVDIDKRLDPLRADQQRLTQVIDNLVSNAIKYNREDGAVWITATRRDDGAALISVRDTGMGIAREDQPRVFERFFRSREGVAKKIEGSGLGLAITKAIVEKHRGQIWLESKPREGSSFFFTLPVQAMNSEGDGDETVEVPQTTGEGQDSRLYHTTGLASEERDVVNDDMQEKRELTQVDSSGDEV